MILKNEIICLSLALDDKERVHACLCLTQETVEKDDTVFFPYVNLHLSGDDTLEHHGRSHLGSAAGYDLKYVSHQITEDSVSQTLAVILQSEKVNVTAFAKLINDTAVIQFWNRVENISEKPIRLEYISSLSAWNINKKTTSWDKDIILHIPSNNWYGESNWISRNLIEHGFPKVTPCSMGRLAIESTGTWSSCGNVPFGVVENRESNQSLFWQIEHNGSWNWEIGEHHDHLYLLASGPSENENNWSKKLNKGEEFTSVIVSAGWVAGGINDALSAAIDYRRKIIRTCADNVQLPVIFNDYMNCLNGDPTTEKLIPLIDKAFETGCEIFCIDCGWYADGYWWDNVGAWKPSKKRFPDGIIEPIRYIRDKGMIPGIWVEIEVMGVNCELVDDWPAEAFFTRHAEKVKDRKRYQLDFRHPKVIEHANAVFDKFVNEYGVGYVKIDYNINAGSGTEINSTSFGDGLLQHNQAYLAWLDSLLEKYPNLIIENCGSGGLRLDYALLKRCSIQSVSDQTDYTLMSNIAASCASCLLPEQAAIWSYPLPSADEEEVITNMVNCMLLRIHQSGYLNMLDPSLVDLVSEGISTYKGFRHEIPSMRPIWPLGLPTTNSDWLAFGLESEDRILLAVWRKKGSRSNCIINFSNTELTGAKCIYPLNREGCKLSLEGNSLEVVLASDNMSRLLEIKK
ncbi:MULTISPECIES: alpha-galactosidase [unclassified Raoultella]|uniref:alpha-galactosidase n=1 Tax=unclassified Raoultella TaxID=2627600 RepID=UPI001356AE53|nr:MULTISPECIES: alpha-galactosidase [unclassified Raoultella]